MSPNDGTALYAPGDYARFYAGPGDGQPFSSKEPYRSNFRRDYARLIHCPSFRRLVGKTQLFPGLESDFFRNRLTHSLEVAQIAKSVAARLNHDYSDFFSEVGEIDTDLVEVAGLAHDIGHPPFGHNGESALDQCMLQAGGFEGNAQSLHIVSRLEKKVIDDDAGEGVLIGGSDQRFGLDFCARTLAAILKYDEEIPIVRIAGTAKSPTKGYYASQSPLVEWIKEKVLQGAKEPERFKVLECYIMDVADDIAYSTYDLEDAFKAGFLSPLDMISARDNIIDAVVDEINTHENLNITRSDVRGVLLTVFEEVLKDNRVKKANGAYSLSDEDLVGYLQRRYRVSRDLCELGSARTQLTSDLVGEFVNSVEFTPNEECPALSVAFLPPDVRLKVEVLKRFAYVSLINSPRLKVAARRGKEIVADIHEKLNCHDGNRLLPNDYRVWYERLTDDSEKLRVVSDFVAGMTDRYAVEFFSRLRAENPQTIFKPI